jgi:hypothetical protein
VKIAGSSISNVGVTEFKFDPSLPLLLLTSHSLAGDRVTPTCGRCFAARRECRRTTLKIRPAKSWSSTPLMTLQDTPDQSDRELSQEAKVGQDTNTMLVTSFSRLPPSEAAPACRPYG